jgi:molecular chaperone DnaK
MTKKKIIGIDLGTTNSVVSILEGSTPIVISNEEGARTTPSVVAFHKDDGELLVGKNAKRQSTLNPKNTFHSIKRFIGCKYDEIKDEITRVSYTVKSDETGKVKIVCPILNKEFAPEEISSLVLKKLVKDASKYLNEKVTDAVITVPAYFNDSQRLATIDAGSIAGLNVLRIINEPTAAALAYGLNKNKNEIVLIFDLGGGTFDVSILEVGDEIFEVLSTAGDTHLGGNDFDNVIFDYIIQKTKEDLKLDLFEDKTIIQRVLEESERVKIELSSLSSTTIDIPYVGNRDGVPLHVNIDFDRSKFEELSANILEKCKTPVTKALQDAKLSNSDLDEVILVGGSTRIPAVRQLLRNLVGKSLNETVNPDEVVAMGAAIQAGIIAGDVTDLLLLDVTPLTLGVETIGGLMTPMITRNTSIPIKQTEYFSTGADNQESVEIHVLQGERPFAKDNKSLGVFSLNGIPPARKGVPRINVTFQLNVDGLLSVSAREESTGQEQSIQIQGASVLDRDEVSKIIKEAQENSETDNVLSTYVTLSYDLDSILEDADQLEEDFATISSQESPVYEYFQCILDKVKNAYDNQSLELITERTLDQLCYVLFYMTYERLSKLTEGSSNSRKIIDI